MESKQYHKLRQVEDSHWWFRSLNDLAVYWVRHAPASGRPRVLDAGCGTGGLLELLDKFADAEGVDASALAVELAAERGVGAVRREDLNDPSLDAESYHAITCIDLLYHRGINDEAATLRHLVAALRPGGTLFLHLPAYDWLRSDHDERVHGIRRYRIGRVREMLTRAGLTVEHASYRLAPLLPAIALARSLSSLFRPRGEKQHENRRSDVELLPAWINGPLLWLCLAENRISRRWTLPFGSSVFAIGRKPQR